MPQVSLNFLSNKKTPPQVTDILLIITLLIMGLLFLRMEVLELDLNLETE